MLRLPGRLVMLEDIQRYGRALLGVMYRVVEERK